ncbi:MAG: YceI family protein [Bacteroidota bacterium]
MKLLPFQVTFVFLLILAEVQELSAQKYSAEKGQIVFFSDAAIEDIRAENNLVGSLFNAATGDLVYIVKIKDFKFHKSLMREHFNEKYLESEKYPKSTFQGKIVGFKPGMGEEQKVRAVGKLMIHGVTRDVDVAGTIAMVNDRILMKSKFIVKLKDYNVKIPSLLWRNIAEEVEVTMDFTYKPI